MRWVRTWRETGSRAAKRQGGGAIEENVDLTLTEITEMLRLEHGASFAPSKVWRFFDRHAMTLKKTARAAEQDRPGVAARREVWLQARHGRRAKLKALLRKAAARTPDKLWDAISDALARFSAKEFTNYFAAAGYGRVGSRRGPGFE